MRQASSRHRTSALKGLSFLLVGMVVAVVATIGTLYAVGAVDLPFLTRKVEAALAAPLAAKPKPAGIPVLLSGRAIPAYTAMTRDYLFNPKTGEPAIGYVSADTVTRQGIITDFEKLRGRVLNHDKPAGYVFKEDDFFPKDTRPGVVAGVPVGKRAFVLDACKIAGIRCLRTGDHFDLVGTMPLDFEKAYAKLHAKGLSDALWFAQAVGNDLPKQARVKVLVQNGTVVEPLTTRELPVDSPSQKTGGPPNTRTVQEITIALDPEEVTPLTAALVIHADLICVARSGRPGESGESGDTTGSAPGPNVTTVETIVNGKRDIVLFLGPGQGPQEPALPPPPPPEPSRKTASAQ